ncbi:MAG: aminotransferase class I/II-fold pyridoxal phosphate-dependent enzyme [Chloroflexota bacterium]
MSSSLSHDNPVYALPDENLIPVSGHLANMKTIPPSRMFLIKKSLRVYQEKYPDSKIYDASQGDGGASLPGTPRAILERAAEIQFDQGTGYNSPYGTDIFRRSVVEHYWGFDADLGYGPTNVLAATGGRDALQKAYQAMLALGYGRQGDALIVSRVPWISYNWGPYGIGANVLWAPGSPESGWTYTEEGIQAAVDFAARSGRKIAGIVITNPDNPTGNTISPEKQAALGRAALKAGVAYVLYDWIYHYVTDSEPMDLNAFLRLFTPEERKRLIFLDGLTKSLGGSNIRNAHLIAAEEVIQFIVARASHSVIPAFYGQAVAMAAYEMGYAEAIRPITSPTNASRKVLNTFLDQHDFNYVIGKGYYAFIDVGPWLESRGWDDTEPLGSYFAEEFGLAVVPGAFFSPYGGQWIRFSYATPPERTQGAAERLLSALESLA